MALAAANAPSMIARSVAVRFSPASLTL
jgi:hypothetical protein